MKFRIVQNKLGKVRVQTYIEDGYGWRLLSECPLDSTIEEAKEWIEEETQRLRTEREEYELLRFDTVVYEVDAGQ